MIEVEPRVCPICGSDDASIVFAPERIDEHRLDDRSFSSRKVPERMSFRLLECRRCDLVYASPAPTEAAVARLYRDASFESGVESRHAARTYAGLLAAVLPRLSERAAALDIGAGDGAFLTHVLEAGFRRVVGIEPSVAPREQAAEGVRELILPAAFSRDAVEGPFTLVTCFQTLEHVRDPVATLRDAARLLAPGGAILAAVHDRRALQARLLRSRSPIFDVEHFQLFSQRSIRMALAAAGLTNVDVHPYANEYPLGYWLQLAPIPARVREVLPSRLVSRTVRIRAGNLSAVGVVPSN